MEKMFRKPDFDEQKFDEIEVTESQPGLSDVFDPHPIDRKMKFGVLVQNATFQIYRSGRLGKKGLLRLKRVLADRKLPFPKTILHMNRLGYGFPFSYAIEEYEMSRTNEGLIENYRFVHPLGNPSIYIDGRDPRIGGLATGGIPFLSEKAKDYFAPSLLLEHKSLDSLLCILHLIFDPSMQPILFHCHSGRHRTGMIAMIIRSLQAGLWLHGPKRTRYGLALNPAQFEYYRYNHLFFREENLRFVEEFMLDPRFQSTLNVFYKRLQDAEKDSDPEAKKISAMMDSLKKTG